MGITVEILAWDRGPTPLIGWNPGKTMVLQVGLGDLTHELERNNGLMKVENKLLRSKN